MKNGFALLAFTAAALAVPAAAGAGQLTAVEAVEIALENSPALEAAEAKASAAGARAKQARGHWLPTVDVVELYHRSNNPAEVFAFQLNQERFDMEAFFAADPNDPDWLNTFMTRLEVIQPLYTGGKLSSRIRQASHMARAGESDRNRVQEMVVFETLTAFTNLAKAREFENLMKKARDTTAEHVALAERYADSGMIVEADLLKARVYLAEMEEFLQQAENNARLAQAALNFHMGVQQSRSHTLASLPRVSQLEGDLEELISIALANRPDLAAARSKLSAGKLEQKVARSGFLPEVAVIGRYDLYDDSLFGSNGDSGALMVNARLNLFRGGSDIHAARAAGHDVAAYEADIRRFEEGIKLEVEQAWRNMKTAQARQATADASLAAAAEALRISERRFEQGLDRMIDLLDSETALRESGVRELVARYDAALASFSLRYACGLPVQGSFDGTEVNR
jgi:outer membrane protein TolC